MAEPRSPRRNSSGLSRDIELLELLASPESTTRGGLGVNRLAQLTGRDKGVISRGLATLADAGLVERDPETLSYRVGSRVYALAAQTREADFVRVARPFIRTVARATRETTHLSVLRGGNVLTILSEISPLDFHTTSWEGVTTAAWRTPSGRVLLSDWDRATLARWYDDHGTDPALPLRTADPPTSHFTLLETPPPAKARVRDFESLLHELQLIRERGYALLDEELEVGVVGASAPVYDFAGRIIAAINVSAPKPRIGDQLEKLGAYVARSGQELSAALGARPRS